MLAVPLVNRLLRVVQRCLGAPVGEGVICDLRTEPFDHLHRMSLRFFTHTKTGELMSRLNNGVVGAQLVALVGPSESGKATVASLLPRFYDPAEGAGTIDGHDLGDLTLSTLSDQIGMVTQETFPFNDTIRANLLYAKTEATPEEIEAACRALQAGWASL